MGSSADPSSSMMATAARRSGIALSLAVLVSCSSPSSCSGPSTVLLRGAHGETTLRVAVARTDAERARGLMGQRRLAPDSGMLFAFPQPTEASFWMKDTLIPLSIAFVDGRG